MVHYFKYLLLPAKIVWICAYSLLYLDLPYLDVQMICTDFR